MSKDRGDEELQFDASVLSHAVGKDEGGEGEEGGDGFLEGAHRSDIDSSK